MNTFKGRSVSRVKTVICLLITVAFFSCMNQNSKQKEEIDTTVDEVESGLKVSGKFLNKKGGEVSITYKKLSGGRMEFDEAPIDEQGRFEFEKNISEPTVVILATTEKRDSLNPQSVQTFDYESYYFKPGMVNMTIASSFKEAQVSGNGAIPYDDDFKAFSDIENAYIDTLNALVVPVDQYLKDANQIEKERARITDSIHLLRDNNLYLRLVKEKPNAPIALLALSRYASEPVWRPRKKINPKEIEQLLELLPDNYLNYPSMIALQEELEISKITGSGKPVIDFELKSKTGEDIRLSDFEGSYVLLDFWASWCAPCRKENPNIKAQYNKYKDKGFTVISVSMDKEEDHQKWLDAIAKDGIGMWTHLIDYDGFKGQVAKSYHIREIPTSFLIDPQGKFIDRNLYGENLNKELRRIFKE